jgi:DNA-binding transcriptional MerR regulator
MITSTPPMVAKNSFYTATEAAKILGVHRNSLSNYRRQRLITPEKDMTTGRYLYSGNELQRFWISRIG